MIILIAIGIMLIKGQMLTHHKVPRHTQSRISVSYIVFFFFRFFSCISNYSLSHVSTDIFFRHVLYLFLVPCRWESTRRTHAKHNLLRCWLYAVRRRMACFRTDSIGNTHLVVFEVYVPCSVSWRLNKDTHCMCCRDKPWLNIWKICVCSRLLVKIFPAQYYYSVKFCIRY